MELGIFLIVTNGMIMQLLSGAQLGQVNFTLKQDRTLFGWTQKRLSWEREAMISLLGKMGHQAFLGQSEELKHSTIKSWLLFMYLRPDLILNTNVISAKIYLINQLSDIVRKKAALAGWLEVLPLARSHDENFKFLRKEDDKGQVVLSSNPATIEFEVVHTSLLPGLLNTVLLISSSSRNNAYFNLTLTNHLASNITAVDPA
ncbi:hypothetical protein H4Q26_013898 [Puccinia striiformis f. sp. tritici PST-130]|nr:hypothetical protein H4Q26_013898 [Puccinia striiformis f. sp. tritici PST-130]